MHQSARRIQPALAAVPCCLALFAALASFTIAGADVGLAETPVGQANSATPQPVLKSPSETRNEPGTSDVGEKRTDVTSAPRPTRLVVSSWAGAYGDAQDRAIIGPVGRKLGIEIERRIHEHPTEGSVRVDPVDATELDQSGLMDACRSGKVLRNQAFFTQQELAGPNGGAGADFFVVPVADCGVPTFAWSSMLVADSDAMKKLAKRRYREPNLLEHLLDTKSFPGKRALIRSPERLLEMMLLASGTKASDVYEALATRRGQDAAFETLNRLSSDVLWVQGPREALLALDQGDVTMAMTYSGRAFRRLISGRLIAIWDGHIIDYASWAVPVTSKNREQAKKFILAATSATSLAAQARIWPYGPMRRSAVALAKRHDLLDRELDEFMPTSDKRFSQGLLFNATFWTQHGAGLRDRFEAWQSGVPLGVRVPPPSKAPPPPPPVIPPLPQR